MATLTGKKKDVDGGWAWMVLLGSFMNLLLASGIIFVSGIFQKLFLEEFGESVAYTAWVTSLFSSLMQLGGPLSSLVTSVTNCRVAVMIGGALIAVGLAASSFATSLNFLLITFGLISGIGLGLMYTPSIVIINYYFDRRRTVMSGLSLSAAGIGITLSPILSRFLIDNTSWREALLILAAVCAHVCLFGALMFPLHEPSSSCAKRRTCCCSSEAEENGDVGKVVSDRHGDVKLTERGVATSCDGNRSNPAGGSLRELRERGETDKHRDVVGHANDVSDVVTAQTHDHHASHQDDVRRTALLNALSRTMNAESREEESSVSTLHGGDADDKNDDMSAERSHFLTQGNDAAAVCERKVPHLQDYIVIEPSRKTGRSSGSSSGNAHFNSRSSLNKISHHLDGTNARVLKNDPDARNNRQYNSAHDLNGQVLPHIRHHRHRLLVSNGSLGRSLQRVLSKGSKLDLRALSLNSSIPSLYSFGLPQVEEIVALLPDSAHAPAAAGECGLMDGDENPMDREGNCSGFKVFKNVPFLFLLANLFFSNAAIGIFNIHLPDFSKTRGLDDHDITFVMSIHGLMLFASRLLLGIMGNDPAVDKLSVYFGLYLIASFLQSLLPFAEGFVGVTAFSIGMGIYYGGVYALLSSLTISIVGLPALAFAFGVEMIFAGVGYLITPPLAGWIVDETASYDNSMYLGGFLMFLSAVCLLFLSCCRPPGIGPIGYHPVTTHLEFEVDDEENEA